MNDIRVNIEIDNRPSGDNVHVVNSEEGDRTEIISFLNSITSDLKLDLDSNDTSIQNIFTNYHTEDELISLSRKTSNQLFICHSNIRSLNKNFDQLRLFANELEFTHSIIGLSETWLKKASPSSLLTLDGYRLITNSRTVKKGGGVGFYVSENLNCELLKDFNHMSETLESIFIEIKIPSQKDIIIGEIYRPPNSNAADFIESLNDLLTKNYLSQKTCYIMGDFNLNLLNYNENTTCQEFLDVMLSLSYVPFIRKPTRIADSTSTLIDNIFVNKSFSDIKSGIIISDITDHFLIYALLPNFMSKSSQLIRNTGIRVMSEQNLSKLRERLKSTDWSPIYNQPNLDACFDNFLDMLTTIYNSTIPLQKPSRTNYKKTPRQPWITKSLLKSINRKNKLFYKYRKEPNTSNKSRYTRYRNVLTSILRLAKENYYSMQFNKYKSDSKSTWKVINEALKTKSDTSPPKQISQDGRQTNDPAAIAEMFNDFFVSLGPNLANKIPKSQINFQSFLTDSNPQSLLFEPATEQEIKCIVKNLNNKKSSGYDGITNFLLKNIINEIISPFLYIFNQSLINGKVPQK